MYLRSYHLKYNAIIIDLNVGIVSLYKKSEKRMRNKNRGRKKYKTPPP